MKLYPYQRVLLKAMWLEIKKSKKQKLLERKAKAHEFVQKHRISVAPPPLGIRPSYWYCFSKSLMPSGMSLGVGRTYLEAVEKLMKLAKE